MTTDHSTSLDRSTALINDSTLPIDHCTSPIDRSTGKHLRQLTYGVEDPQAVLLIDPVAVTCIAPSRLPGVSRVYHNDGAIDLVNGTPQAVWKALYGSEDQANERP